MKIDPSKIIAFFEDLAMLLSSGSQLNQALTIIIESQTDIPLKTVLQQMKTSLQQGVKLSDSAAAHPQLFDNYCVGMIKSGEASGKLDESLRQLAQQLDNDRELRAQISTALIYPSILLIAMGLSLIVILGVILPKFTELFKSFETQLSPAGHALLAIGNFVNNWGMWLLALALIMSLSIWLFRVQIKPKTRMMNALKTIPSVRKVLDQVDFARFTATLASLLEAGLSQTEALDIAKDSLSQEHNTADVIQLTSKVKDGMPLGEGLMQLASFDKLYAHSISNGDRAGQLPGTLRTLATRMQKDFSKRAHRLALIIEPVMILGLGLLVGVVVYTVFSALQNLGNLPL